MLKRIIIQIICIVLAVGYYGAALTFNSCYFSDSPCDGIAFFNPASALMFTGYFGFIIMAIIGWFIGLFISLLLPFIISTPEDANGVSASKPLSSKKVIWILIIIAVIAFVCWMLYIWSGY